MKKTPVQPIIYEISSTKGDGSGFYATVFKSEVETNFFGKEYDKYHSMQIHDDISNPNSGIFAGKNYSRETFIEKLEFLLKELKELE